MKPEGKFFDKNHICLKPTNVENMYPIDNEKYGLVTKKNSDEYPEYKKNENGEVHFTRKVELDKSNQKMINETDYLNKAS